MISKKKIDFRVFDMAQFAFRDEKDVNNVFLYLLRRIAGTAWQVSPFKPGQQVTLQKLGNALGFNEAVYKEILTFHDNRLKLEKRISSGIYYLVSLSLVLPILIPFSSLINTYPIYFRALFGVVFFLYMFVSVGIVYRFSQFVTLRFFADSMSIQRIMYILIELARCQNPLLPFHKRKLLGHITFLVKATHSLIYAYNLNTKTLDWAIKHLRQVELFIQEREKWIIAPRDSTLENLQQDFYDLSLIYLSGNFGDFEYDDVRVDITENKPNSNFRNFIVGIPRIAIGILIPVLGLLTITLQPDLIANIIDIKVLTLLCIGWFLLAIDVILKLGIVSSVIGVAKGIKDLT